MAKRKLSRLTRLRAVQTASRAGLRDNATAGQPALRQYFESVAVPVQVTPAYAAFCNDLIAANLPTAPGWRERLRQILRTARW